MIYELISETIEPDGDIIISQEIYDQARKHFIGKQVHIMIEEYSPKHSKEARRYLMGAIVRTLAEAAGRPMKEMWEILKAKLTLREVFMQNGGEIYYIYDSTQGYTKAELWDFTQRAKSWAEDLGIQIESPEQYFNRRAAEKAERRRALIQNRQNNQAKV